LRRFLKLAAFLLAAVLAYGTFIEPYWIRVTDIEISQEPFASFFKEHKTVFISDLHVSELGVRERKLLQAVEQIDPDIILIGGDSTPWGGGYDRTFDFLSQLRAREGIYGVLGDSDYQNARKSCRFCHAFNPDEKPLPVRFLQNQAVKPYGEAVAIAGLDMFPLDQDERRPIRETLVTGPTVLLTQKQVRLEDLPKKPVLVLSGDTHGGQAWMPEWLWRLAFGGAKGEVRYGIKREGEKTLVVSSGIGVNLLPFRFLARPEVVVVKGK
jgi:predicted MPP superfamily phosphohydrolase